MHFPFRSNIRQLTPYSTARDEFGGGGHVSVWLDANESPYENGVNRYPDPHQRVLKQRLAHLMGVTPDRLFLGNGSDEAIDLCYRLFCEPGRDNAVAITPSYGMYAVAAAINDVALREVRLEADTFGLPLDRLLAACDARTRLMWICSPNNPTGNAFPATQLESLADAFGGMLVVDEAYIDFADEPSLVGTLARHPNLIILRTLSKAWGMAGLRLGMAIADPEVIEMMGRVKYPYNINGPTQVEVLKRLGEEQAHEAQVAEIITQRKRLLEALTGIRCIERVYPSQANFILVKVSDAAALYDYLMQRGIIVRNRSRLPLCENTLRLTVGTPDENDRLLASLELWVK